MQKKNRESLFILWLKMTDMSSEKNLKIKQIVNDCLHFS